MSSYRVVISEGAENDLIGIYQFILENTGSPTLALERVDHLFEQCHKLHRFPHRGIQRNDIRPGLRLLPIERRSLIAYIIDAEVVRVTNIFHAGQDFDTLLRDP